jgi:hypothetical protein
MSKQRFSDKRHRRYVQNLRVAATLLDGSKGFEEIVHRYYSYLIPLGLFKRTERQTCDQTTSLNERLYDLVGCGWIICEDERYVLTSLGCEE